MALIETTHHLGCIPYLLIKQAHEHCAANKDNTALSTEVRQNCRVYEKRFARQLEFHHSILDNVPHLAPTEISHKFEELKATLSDLLSRNVAHNEVCSAENKIPENATVLLSAFKSNVIAEAALKREDVGAKVDPSPDDDVNSAFSNTEITREFYQSIHKLNLNTMLTGPLLSLVRFGAKEDDTHGFANAFWNGFMMVYGCGGKIFTCLSKAMDVAVHEISHGVTQMMAGTKVNADGKPTGLNYTGDAGGLNEANSDQAAVAAVQRFNWHQASQKLSELQSKGAAPKEIQKQQKVVNDLANPTILSDNRWKIGFGIIRSDKRACLRDMANPGTAYANNAILGNDIQLGFEVYNAETYAQADPHQTSAAGNKWFYELSCELYRRLGIPTWEAAENLRFEALQHCPPDVTYPQYAAITMRIAEEMDASQFALRSVENRSAIADSVKAAWKKVGIEV